MYTINEIDNSLTPFLFGMLKSSRKENEIEIEMRKFSISFKSILLSIQNKTTRKCLYYLTTSFAAIPHSKIIIINNQFRIQISDIQLRGSIT